jgi:hypothetical protein
MSLLVRDGATIRLRDHSEWRWQLELSNRQAAPEALVASTATGR